MGVAGVMVAGRKGQATPITVTIMIGLTLALGIALFAFFQGQVAGLSLSSQINSIVISTAGSVKVGIVGSERDLAESPSVYCFTVTFTNVGGGALSFSVTLLPISKVGGSILADQLARVYPVKAGSLDRESGLNLRVFLIKDLDGDGIADIVGKDPVTLAEVSITEQFPECRTLYSTPSYWDRYYRPTVYAYVGDIYLSEGFTLESLYRGVGVSYYPEVPFWRLYLEPGETVTMIIAVALDDPLNPGAILELTSGSIAIFAEVAGDYYLATTIPVNTT